MLMRRENRRGNGRHRRGQTLTEFAIILPFLILLVAAIVDFGFLFFDHVATQAACREGGRGMIQAHSDSTPLYSDAQLIDIIKQAHGPFNQIKDGEITFSTLDNDPAFDGTQTSRTIEIAHIHTWLLPVMIPFGETIVIRARIKGFLVPGVTHI